MKKTLVALFLLTCSVSASAACTISGNYQGVVSEQIRKNGYTFADYDLVCAKLKAANAAIVIVGSAAVLANSSIGWVSISVKDVNSAIGTTDYSRNSTQVNSFASQDKADKLVMLAINEALNSWEALDQALVALDEARKQTKATLLKKK